MTTNRTRRAAPLVVFVGLALGIAAASSAQDAQGADRTVSLFRERVARYAEMRRSIVRELDAHRPDREERADFGQTLASAIQEARRDATPGEILCPEIAGRMLQLLRTDMARRPLPDQQAILSEVPQVLRIRLNDIYPDGEPLATVPPLLLLQLEPLPPELQYRFLHNALILLDIETNVIVDFIPNAFRRSS
jgi:hypothetical protein